MSKSGKTSTIFLVVLSVFFVCTTGISVFFFLKEAETSNSLKVKVESLNSTQAKLQADLQETKTQMQLTDEKKKEAEATIDNLKNELQVEQGLKAELKKQNQDLSDQLAQEKQAREELQEQGKKELAAAEQRAGELQQKLDLVSKQKDEIEAKRAELETQYKDIKTKLDSLSAAPDGDAPGVVPGEGVPVVEPAAANTLEGTVPLGTIVVNPEQPASAAGDRGKIITIDKDAEFLIVSLGVKDGVTADSVMSVYRGEKLLGEVKATRVLEDMSAVDFVPPLNSQAVTKEDRVVLKK